MFIPALNYDIPSPWACSPCSLLGPERDINLTQSETCALSFMSQDSSTAIDKAETILRPLILEHISMILADDGNSLILITESDWFLKTRNRVRFLSWFLPKRPSIVLPGYLVK